MIIHPTDPAQLIDIRTHLASQAMIGILASDVEFQLDHDAVSKLAIDHADHLIDELNISAKDD